VVEMVSERSTTCCPACRRPEREVGAQQRISLDPLKALVESRPGPGGARGGCLVSSSVVV